MNKSITLISVLLIICLTIFGGYMIVKRNILIDNQRENHVELNIASEENNKVEEEKSFDEENKENEVIWDETQETLEYKAKEYLKQMTLDEKIGQLFLVRFPNNGGVTLVKENSIGGYLFFERDFKDKTKEQVISMINEVQSASKIPLIIAVDEEGGTVDRIGNNKNLVNEKFKSPSELYDKGGFDLIRQDTIEKSAILKEFGINLNLAPVVDISDPSDYMYERTLKQGVEATQEFAKTVIEASKGTGVSYTLKHFPGYGHNSDTHKSNSNDTRTYEEILKEAVPPFEAGIEAGAEAILISHNIVECMDNKNPASISGVIHDFLRNDLNFKGIIITDDLSMGALANIEDIYIKAVASGNNLIITSDYENAIKQIKDAVKNNVLTEEQIDELVEKTIVWKYGI